MVTVEAQLWTFEACTGLTRPLDKGLLRIRTFTALDKNVFVIVHDNITVVLNARGGVMGLGL